ncbi:MAG: hypothetical protein IPL61_32280 [Myxococcales bacterium]|nr:hypothetical protein [Myxococcales bacterium]
MRSTPLILVGLCAALATGCPPPKGTGPAAGGSQINPSACGDLSTDKVTRKLHAFLAASADLDRATAELERSVHDACVRMTAELGVATDGDTRTVCARAADELKANLAVSVSQEQRLVTRYEPPVCTSEISFTAGLVAECEASVAADVAVRCEGTCSGTCNGACDGTCATTGADGQCAGTCSGTCNGSCAGSCAGYASVDASAECRASAEIQASVHTECTEPKVVVVTETVTVIDDAKFQRATAAINAGMPTLLKVGARAELVGKALGRWVSTGAALVQSSGQLVGNLGERGLCVAGQLAATVAAVAQIQARISVSIEVSASVSASAGGSAQ